MWLLTLLPSGLIAFIVNLILILGVVGFAASWFFGYVVRFLPSLLPYRMMIQIASIVLLIIGVYFKGGQVVEEKWRERVAELEAKVAVAEAQSKDANVQLAETLRQKNKVITETKVVIKDRIVRETVTIDAKCDVPKEALNILNDAARTPK